MSFEAVPCMFRSAPGPNGETEYLGLLIRPSNNAPNVPSSSPSQNGPIRPMPPAGPLKVQGVFKSGAPITVGGENAPKLLVPANVQVRLAAGHGDVTVSTATAISSNGQSWHTPTTVRMSSALTATTVSSPSQQNPRSASVCSSSPFGNSSPMSPAVQPMVNQQLPANPYKNNQQADSRVSMHPAPSSSHWPMAGDSSLTPDSGIQSTPCSPQLQQPFTPNTAEACSSVCEDRADDDDYTDMPQLMPVGQDETDLAQQPGPSGIREETASLHGSECETPGAASISITPGMDSRDIVEQLLQLDPDKASDIAKLIRRKTLEKRRSSSRQELFAPKKARPESAASDELRKSEEEMMKEESPPVLADMTEGSGTGTEGEGKVSKASGSGTEVSVPVPTTPEAASSSAVGCTEKKEAAGSMNRKQYREAVQQMLQKRLNTLLEKTVADVADLHIGERERHERRGGGVAKLFHVDWDAVRKRARKEEDAKRRAEKKRRSDSLTREGKNVRESAAKASNSVLARRKKRGVKECADSSTEKERVPSRSSLRTPNKRRSSECPLIADDVIDGEKKREMDYETVRRSFSSLPDVRWRSASVHCGCTRGACTSDAECINRALLVQCPPSCAAVLCVNKKFWKEDMVRTLLATGPRSKRVLKTKTTRRAGDFLGEFAGEVIDFSEALSRWASYEQRETQPRILCLSHSLFVDATEKGNIARYVRHSCNPNSRIEVWSIDGHRRAGIFSLFDISSSSEITVDMDRLVPIGRQCTCGAKECRGRLRPARNAILSSSDEVSIADEKIIRNTRIFLLRNRERSIRMAARNFSPTTSAVPTTLKDCMRSVLNGLQLRIRRIDGSLPYAAVAGYSAVCRLLRSDCSLESFQLSIDSWLDTVDDDDVDRVYSGLTAHYLSPHLPADNSKSTEKKRDARSVKREMDLRYLETQNKVGSYNPDDVWPTGKAREGDDAVRCECGSLEEDGEMLQCDTCHFWLHTDCVGNINDQTDYECKFCTGVIKGVPSTNVLLAKQPEIRLEGCQYYKALNNRRAIQVRLNETVYVEKTESDEHKKILKRLSEHSEKCSSKSGKRKEDPVKGRNVGRGALIPPQLPGKLPAKEYERKDLRIFRVERLFAAPSGPRFVFGFYYARPHETICDSNRIFHRSEVFATPFYDTLPLDSVVGKCAVLDADVWCKGRPLVPLYKEEDVFVCEYQIDRNQRSFEKIPAKYRFFTNTQPYVFRCFEEKKQMVRDFTPFLVGDRGGSRCSSRTAIRTERAKREGERRQMATDRLNSIVTELNKRTKKGKKHSK